MTTDDDLLREHIIAQAIKYIPKAFLVDFHGRVRRAYPDVFAGVAADPTCLPEQRIFKLMHDRCFRLDWELIEAAKASGLNATSRLLSSNKWQHGFVSAGAFGFTQSYVQRMGELPQSAKFREELAEAARCPRLPLDDPAEIYRLREFYGLFASNPVGRRFVESDQQLGALCFCVPYNDMRGWAAEIPVPELIASYPADKKESRKGPEPTWKRRPGEEEA